MSQTRFTVKTIILTEPLGERIPLVIDSLTGIPHSLSNQYLLSRRRGIVSLGTVRKEANVLSYFFNWLNLDQNNFLSLENLNNKEIVSLWEYLRESSERSVVSGAVHMFRWKVIQKYLDYNFSKQLIRTSHKDSSYSNLVEKKKLVMKEFNALSYSSKTRRLQGLSDKSFELVVKLTRHERELNPFIKRDRLRNEIIVDLLGFLGMRAGEVLKLSLDCVVLTGSTPHLVIKKVEDDEFDPRKDEPRVKTFGRVLNIDINLSRKIEKYLKQRRSIKEAKKSKYLFVSHVSGKPLSYRRLSDLMQKIEDSHKDLQGLNITAHSLRRTWNDHFRQMAEKDGLSEEVITQSQNYLQGRVLDSSEAYKYAAKSIERQAREKLLDLQEQYLNRSLS